MPSSELHPSFDASSPLDCGRESHEILLNNGMKCSDSAFNARGSRAFIDTVLTELFPQENFSKGWKSFSRKQGIWEKIFSLNILKSPRCKNLPQKTIDKYQ